MQKCKAEKLSAEKNMSCAKPYSRYRTNKIIPFLPRWISRY